MIFSNIDISISSSVDARLLIKDKICNPALIKEVNSPVSRERTITICNNSFYLMSTMPSINNYIKHYLELNQEGLSISALESLQDDELTKMCMLVSEKSLSKEWENEDDERWSKFLNE